MARASSTQNEMPDLDLALQQLGNLKKQRYMWNYQNGACCELDRESISGEEK